MKNWKLLHLNFAAAVALCGSGWAQAEPHLWLLHDGAELRLPAPPDATASQSELRELKTLLAQTSGSQVAQIQNLRAHSPLQRWMQIGMSEVNKHKTPGPLGTRALALLAAGLSDAVTAGWDSKSAYRRLRPSEQDVTLKPVAPNADSFSYPSEEAVVGSAALAILSYLYLDDAAELRKTAAAFAELDRLSGNQFPSDIDGGNRLGASVGARFVAYAKTDGSDVVWQGRVPSGPGTWNGTNPVLPLAGAWKPWVLSSGAEFRLSPPPAYQSAEQAEQIAAVRNLDRSPQITAIAKFWQPGFSEPWLNIVDKMLAKYQADTDLPKAASVYALTFIAQHDASLACWDTKYVYWEMRPDQLDPTFKPVFATPAHPGYPSGHACGGGSAGAVLEALFPADAPYFRAKAQETGDSTFYAGVHLPNDVAQGLKQGREVGEKVVRVGGR